MSDGSDDPSGEPTDDADPVDEWVREAGGDAEDDHPDADPFERIDGGSGPRRGDPFDAFAATEDADDFEAEGAMDETANGLPEELPSGADETADDPFTAFDAPATDPFGEGETVFDRPEAGDADADGVWERMESEADAEAVPGKRYVDVNKHAYCESCEYFSEPPEVACAHEGTDILEFVDSETVRVVDCPVVAERTALEDVE